MNGPRYNRRNEGTYSYNRNNSKLDCTHDSNGKSRNYVQVDENMTNADPQKNYMFQNVYSFKDLQFPQRFQIQQEDKKWNSWEEKTQHNNLYLYEDNKPDIGNDFTMPTLPNCQNSIKIQDCTVDTKRNTSIQNIEEEHANSNKEEEEENYEEDENYIKVNLKIPKRQKKQVRFLIDLWIRSSFWTSL